MKIIHVDDHIYALEEMKLDLPQIVPEAELHSFNHPDQALAFAEAEGCDVLLTEIELWTERLGGIRLAKAIREINPCVSIIFVTVCSENEVARELSGLPVSGFLPKLWKSEELTAAFQNLRDPKKPTHNHVNHAADAAQNKEEKSMKHRSKKLWSILLALTLALSLVPAFSMTALAADNVSTYTLQIPATLTVSAAGWNATSGLTASVTSGDTFDSGKKLTVTAASANSWALKNGSNSVGYNLATATGTYSSSATPASWEFTAAELNASGGTNKAMGIIVDDYSTKPAGTYQDTVTFTAKVEDAVVIHTTLAVGDVIHLGEVLSISTNYSAGGQVIQSSKSPFTLVRANVSDNPGYDTTVTEAEDGQYYVLKGSDGSYCVYIGTPGTSEVAATSTSDGIIVNTLNGNTLYFTTHEPQQ